MKKVASWLVALCIFAGILAPMALAGVNDCIGLEDGAVYYIKNVSTGRYLDVEWGYTANGSNVGNYGFSGATNQRWKLQRVSGFTYRLIPMHAQDKFLDVTGDNVDIWSNLLSSQQFTFARTQGKYMMTKGTSFSNTTNVVAVADSGNNVSIRSFATACDVRAVWSFEKVTKETFDYVSFTYPGFDTTLPAADVTSAMSAIGYPSRSCVNFTASAAYSYLQSDGAWLFSGHGATLGGTPSATLLFKAGTGSDNGFLTTSYDLYNNASDRAINSLPENALAKARCVLYMGCNTGTTVYVGNNEYNLAASTYLKGAHCALGPTKITDITGDDKWIRGFFDKETLGGTIQQCIEHANLMQKYDDCLYVIGDTNAKIS